MPAPSSIPAASRRRRFAGWIRRNIVTIWLASLPVLIAYAVITRGDVIVQNWHALAQTDPGWLLAGLAIQILIMLSPVLTYKVILRRLGHTLPFLDLTVMQMQRIVVGTFTPVGGPVATITFIRALGHRAVSAHDAVTMLMLRSVATNAAFFSFVLVLAAMRGPIYVLGGAAVAVAATAAAGKMARQTALPCWLGPFAWRKRLPRAVSTRLIEFAVRFRRHQLRAADMLTPIAITLATRLASVALLVVSLEAIGAAVTLQVIALASMAEIAAKAAVPVFQGIGAVEVATALALRQAGVPAEQAIGVALLWRMFEFYLPVTVALAVSGALTRRPRVARREPRLLPKLPLPRITPSPAPIGAGGQGKASHPAG